MTREQNQKVRSLAADCMHILNRKDKDRIDELEFLFALYFLESYLEEITIDE